jgi:diguanylate cyclase (GGDEF)-like protein
MVRRPRISVQARLLGAFGLVVLLMLAVGLFALDRLRSDNQHLSTLASRVVPSTRAVGDINALLNKYRKDQLHYIVALPTDRPLGVKGSVAGDLAEDLTLMEVYLDGYRLNGLVEDERDGRLLADFRSSFARYVAITARFRQLADEGRTIAASRVVGDGPGDARWDRLKVVIGQWDNHKVDTAEAEADASEFTYRISWILILGLLAAALAVAVTVAILLARRTTRAVRDIGAAAKAIAGGDIDQHVAVRSHDELGEMAADFDAMTESLRSTVALAEAIAAGDLTVEVQPRSERDALGTALAAMTQSLRSLVAENDLLLAASREEANTDPLTGLGNRRALARDLAALTAQASEERRLVLSLFDLDGFKQYNDTFGHPAGDQLLVRLGDRLQQALGSTGTAYRMSGDEFCLLALADGDSGTRLAARAAAALTEQGEGFTIGCSYGVATLPGDADTPEDVLRLADRRMYEVKSERASASRQSTDVLLRVLGERSPGLHEHTSTVAGLARDTAERLGLPEHEVKRVALAAELHDVGKAAIPEAILEKPGALDDEEWRFMRRHTEIGERIIMAAPSLAHVADLLRSSHERHDGCGYPDRLAGDEIPLGASIIAVCDAFDAMTSARAYSAPVPVAEALAELRRCAGSQFRPEVVEAFCTLVGEQAPASVAA